MKNKILSLSLLLSVFTGVFADDAVVEVVAAETSQVDAVKEAQNDSKKFFESKSVSIVAIAPEDIVNKKLIIAVSVAISKKVEAPEAAVSDDAVVVQVQDASEVSSESATN